MTNESVYKTAGARRSFLCATFGLMLALTLVFLTFNVTSERSEMLAPVILGIIGLYGSAYLYGGFAGKIASRVGIDSYKVWLIGVLLAWSCVMTMALAGSMFFFLTEFGTADAYQTFYSYILLPLVWIAAWGWIPALILGLIWASMLKSRFRTTSR